jgi:hypothetical protein
MSNENYQKQAREQQRRDDEARFRRGLEDYARSQKEQQTRNAESSKRAYSKNLGRMGSGPSLFGPGVDLVACTVQDSPASKVTRRQCSLKLDYSPLISVFFDIHAFSFEKFSHEVKARAEWSQERSLQGRCRLLPD